MANNGGPNDNSHQDDIYVQYDGEVADGELVSPTPLWHEEPREPGDFQQAVMRHAATYQQRGNTQEATQHQNVTAQGRQQGGVTQTHQQAEQSKDTRAYAAEKGEAASLATMRQDATRSGQERGENQSLSTVQRDAQTVANQNPQLRDEQRLNREQSQQQDKARTDQQSKEQGKEQAHEQEKTPGR